jgi:hypothetical protein
MITFSSREHGGEQFLGAVSAQVRRVASLPVRAAGGTADRAGK